MATKINANGTPVVTPSGSTITSTASNVVQGAGNTAIDVATGSATAIVGGLSGAAAGVVGSAVSAVAAPVIDIGRKINTTYEVLKNPSLGGALALLGQGFPPYRNELDKFASYNYIITLSCLTDFELNFPLTYRTLGPAVTIIKSGGTAGKKIPTIYETDGQREFFIEDLEIEQVVAPNSKSGHANSTRIDFNVIEPYSMGQFLHNLRTAALVTGHGNYLEAPYLLSVEFIGYKDDGNIEAPFLAKRHFPINIVQADMNVTAGGATYACSAVPVNEVALYDSNRKTKTDADVRGGTVGEVLQSGVSSLSSVINETMIKREEASQTAKSDVYVISFPMSTAGELLSGAASTAAGATATPSNSLQGLYESLTGIKGGEVPPEFQAKLAEAKGITAVRAAIAETIKATASNNALWNSIGKSKITKSFLDGGKQPFGEPSFLTMDSDAKHVQRSKLSTSDDNRRLSFPSGMGIDEIIEEVILSSEYARALANAKPNAKGQVPWFRIETQVFNITALLSPNQPRVFVYRVVPYMVDASKIASASAGSFASLFKQASALKAYSYIYTGQNKDIIDFDLQFNMAFISNIGATGGQMQKDSKKGNTDQLAAGDKDPNFKSPKKIPLPSQEGKKKEAAADSTKSGKKGGGIKEHVENSIARMFNENILRTDDDMINVDLKIHGDPYYLTDAGLGNFFGIDDPLSLGITLEGAMNPRNGEVDVILNFRTPIDYDGTDGYVKFPLGGFLPIAMFSGSYQVIMVTNRFSKGQYTVNLDLVRRKNQDITLEGLASSVLSFFQNNSLVPGSAADQVDEKQNTDNS